MKSKAMKSYKIRISYPSVTYHVTLSNNKEGFDTTNNFHVDPNFSINISVTLQAPTL